MSRPATPLSSELGAIAHRLLVLGEAADALFTTFEASVGAAAHTRCRLLSLEGASGVSAAASATTTIPLTVRGVAVGFLVLDGPNPLGDATTLEVTRLGGWLLSMAFEERAAARLAHALNNKLAALLANAELAADMLEAGGEQEQVQLTLAVRHVHESAKDLVAIVAALRRSG